MIHLNSQSHVSWPSVNKSLNCKKDRENRLKPHHKNRDNVQIFLYSSPYLVYMGLRGTAVRVIEGRGLEREFGIAKTEQLYCIMTRYILLLATCKPTCVPASDVSESFCSFSERWNGVLMHEVHLGQTTIYLGLHYTQYLIGNIVRSNWKGRGNQYIQLVKILYCKLPAVGKQLSTFPHKVQSLNLQTSEVGDKCVTAAPPWPAKTRVRTLISDLGGECDKVVYVWHLCTSLKMGC